MQKTSFILIFASVFTLSSFPLSAVAASVNNSYNTGVHGYAQNCAVIPMFPKKSNNIVSSVKNNSSDINSLPIVISADYLSVDKNNNALYRGDVEVLQGARSLKSQDLFLERDDQNLNNQVKVNGDFDYQDNLIEVSGHSALFNLSKDQGSLDKANYQFVGRQGRGDAQKLQLFKNKRLADHGTFTSCLLNDNAWSISAEHMEQDLDKEILTMRNVWFKIKDTRVMYLPYLYLPIGTNRKSGLLIPDFKFSKRDGIYYSQPLYLNILPNYDMTITPEYMSHRGLKLNVENRYLFNWGTGSVVTEYMKHDRLSSFENDNKSRHLFYWQHSSVFDNLRFDVHYTHIGDGRYFSDFDSSYGRSTTSYNVQELHGRYEHNLFNLDLLFQRFQIFDKVGIQPYALLPQLSLEFYKQKYLGVYWGLKAKASYFYNESKDMPRALRFHVEPSGLYSYDAKYFALDLEAKAYLTQYFQSNLNKIDGEGLSFSKNNISRFIPQFKADLATEILVKNKLFPNIKQTIEPHLQYLYRPFVNQENIGLSSNRDYWLGYDSTLMQQNYNALFRDRRYSGLDRISSANQLTLGAKTIFFNAKDKEFLNLAVGQVFYFASPRITPNSSKKYRRSSLSFEGKVKFSPNLGANLNYQYDPILRKTSFLNSSIEYRLSSNNLLQLNYRQTSQDYIDQNLIGGINRYNQSIRQVGATLAFDINENWAVVGRYYHDLALKKMVEQYVAIEYKSCCWGIEVIGKQQLTSTPPGKADGAKDVYYDRQIGVKFELRGLSKSSRNKQIKQLNDGLLPYVAAGIN